MKRRKRTPEEEPPPSGAPEWMVTYSDLVTLLLCFFVLLYSMATISAEKFEQVSQSLKMSFQSSANRDKNEANIGKDILAILQNDKDETETKIADPQNEISIEKANLYDEMLKKIREIIINFDLGEYISILDLEDSIILRINSLILFDLGSADIKSTAQEPLLKLGEVLDNMNSKLIVQGHTDDLPINTLLFPSNWELSTKRATNIVMFLIRESRINPSLLTATGNAEFSPIAPNDTPENRMKNRRIDIVIPK
jgi:chemotaxis protein MotB